MQSSFYSSFLCAASQYLEPWFLFASNSAWRSRIVSVMSSESDHHVRTRWNLGWRPCFGLNWRDGFNRLWNGWKYIIHVCMSWPSTMSILTIVCAPRECSALLWNGLQIHFWILTSTYGQNSPKCNELRWRRTLRNPKWKKFVWYNAMWKQFLIQGGMYDREIHKCSWKLWITQRCSTGVHDSLISTYIDRIFLQLMR